MRSNPPIAGFTLPEVLTSVTIVGLVLIALYSCWAAVLGATKSSSIAVQHIQRERAAIRAISEALGGLSWYESGREDPLHLDDSFGFSHLKLISRVPPGFWGERELGDYPLRRIEFLTEDKPDGESQLVMIQQALLASPNSAVLHRTVLLPRVETFTIEVLPWQPFNSQSWQTSWPLTDDQIEDLVENWKTLKAQSDTNGSTNVTDKLTDAANTLLETRGLPLQAKVSLGVIEGFPRNSTLPIFASKASHAKRAIIPTIDWRDFESDPPMDPDSESDSRVVFIIDKSSSMRDGKLDMAKGALLNTLKALAADSDNKNYFYIYFFDKDLEPQDAMNGTSAMREANNSEINNFLKWIYEQVPALSRRRKAWGDDGIVDAITGAFSHAPTDINLITDAGTFKSVATGKMEELPIVDLIKSKNAAADTPAKVNVYVILNKTYGDREREIRGTESEQVLRNIAEKTGGKIEYIKPWVD